MSSAVVLLSGGLDSTVLLHYVARELGKTPVYALSLSYGQKHSRELDMAVWQADHLGAVSEHCVVQLPVFEFITAESSALIRGGDKVPDLQEIAPGDRDQPPTYVPNRNMIMLSIAVAAAEARECATVYYAAQKQDEYGYWDCTEEFVDRFNTVLELNRRQSVTVEAPFVNYSKAEVVRIGQQLNVDFAKTWSCYRGAERPCGVCPTCIERQQAFKEAGVRDPL
ncbi:MAG: 7-cyano-7-deazaguanine synthase QueC [Lentisphaeria bacterium]